MHDLGFGIHPCQGFPVRGSLTVDPADTVASSLIPPDVRVSRIRRSRVLSTIGMHKELHGDS